MDYAESGGSVVERYKEGGYDLIFMDLQMPGVDGYAATRAIRAWEEAHGLPRIPIVALTANADGEVQRKSALAGCMALFKPPATVGRDRGSWLRPRRADGVIVSQSRRVRM
jgi:CheY-like chemotaxis protein